MVSMTKSIIYLQRTSCHFCAQICRLILPSIFLNLKTDAQTRAGTNNRLSHLGYSEEEEEKIKNCNTFLVTFIFMYY